MSTIDPAAPSSDFFAVAGRQRACRHFLPDPLPDAELHRILNAATKAPSSENHQPWVLVVVKDPERRRQLVRIMLAVWEAGKDTAQRAQMDPAMRDEVASGFEGALAVAPVVIVVGGDTSLVSDRWMASSIYPAVQNLLLATYAAGAASTLTTIATARADELREVVGFPPEIAPYAIVPIGYPARSLGPPRRKPVEDCTFSETYGRPWAAAPAPG